MRHPLRWGIVAALVVFIADQVSKYLILLRFAPLPRSERYVVVFPSWLDFVDGRNSGVTFGMFNNNGTLNAVIFAVVAAAIVIALTFWLRQVKRWWLAIAIGMIIGGAIGNAMDRVRMGAVVDFIDFFIGSWHWYTFNVADAGICIGVGVLLLDSLAGRRESPK